MESRSIAVKGGHVSVTARAAEGGTGVVVNQRLESGDKRATVTVTCTCWEGDKSYSTTKECPGISNTCDCSEPTEPKIICG